MAPKISRRDEGDGSTLPFDVTQEIDRALADELRHGGEQTLTQTGFDEITLVLPEKQKPRRQPRANGAGLACSPGTR